MFWQRYRSSFEGDTFTQRCCRLLSIASGFKMENLELQEQIQGLKRLSQHYEAQLKLVGLELCDLPDDITTLLNKCVDLKVATQLHELDLNYMREFYFTHKQEFIDNKMVIAQQTVALKKLTDEIDESARDITILENLIDTVNKEQLSAADLQKNIKSLETKKQVLQDKRKAYKIPSDFNIVNLMNKVDEVKKMQQHK